MRLVFVLLLASLTGCAQGVKTAIEHRVAEYIIDHRKDLVTAKPQEGITRGSVTGQATAPGFDHPDEYITEFATPVAVNMEPVVPHPEEEAQGAATASSTWPTSSTPRSPSPAGATWTASTSSRSSSGTGTSRTGAAGSTP